MVFFRVHRLVKKLSQLVSKAVLVSLVVVSAGLAAGLPGEYLLNNSWRQAFFFGSPLNNPAFMMEEPYFQIRGVSSLPFNNAASLHELGLIIPLDLYNTAGFTLVAESGKLIRGVTFEGDSLVDDGSARNNNLLMLGSYAINPWGKFSGGVNLNIGYQGNFGDPIWGIGTDVGVSYRVALHPVLGYHMIGLTYKNILSHPGSEEFRIPFSSQLATQYYFSALSSRLEFDYQFLINDIAAANSLFSDKEKTFDLKMGFGVGITPVPFLKFRAFTNANQSEGWENVGVALGLDLPKINGGRELSLLYQFSKDLNSDLLGIQSIYVTAQLGPHREELYARRMAIHSRISPSSLYNQAMHAYFKENYWDAYFAFSRLMVESPGFFKNDAVSFYASSCLEELDMREAALNFYQSTKKKFKTSPFVHEADLGMLRIYYREGRYDDVESQYNIITGSKGSDLVKQHAAYYMGETEVVRENYLWAIKTFQLVTDTHPAYVFALHSSATALQQLDHDKQIIIHHLLKVVDAPGVSTAAQREIVSRSLVLLGYLYYEDNLLSKAVTALRMVPQKSYYYEDALLGLGWSAVKAGQASDCITYGEELSSISKKMVIICEGKLIHAFGYIQKKDYQKAETLLVAATELLEKYKLIDLYNNQEIKKYDSSRIAYDSLAQQVVKTAEQLFAKKRILSLHSQQIALKSSIDSSMYLSDEQKRVRFFEKSIFKLKEELEYALATVKRIQTSVDYHDEERRENREKELNEEIENLKRKMNDIHK